MDHQSPRSFPLQTSPYTPSGPAPHSHEGGVGCGSGGCSLDNDQSPIETRQEVVQGSSPGCSLDHPGRVNTLARQEVAFGRMADRPRSSRLGIVAALLVGGAVLTACGSVPQSTSTVRLSASYVRSACASNGFPAFFDRQPIGTGISDGYGVAFYAQSGRIGVCVRFPAITEYGGPTRVDLLPGPVRVDYTATPDGHGMWALVSVSKAVSSLKVLTSGGSAAIHHLSADRYLVWTPQSFVRAFDSPADVRRRVVIGMIVGFNRFGIEVGSDELFACGKLDLDAGGSRGFAENAPVCPPT